VSQPALRAAPAQRTTPEPGRTSGRAVRYRISSDPSSLATQARELWQARDLFLLLLGREIRVRYRQTLLGVAWVVLQPLVPALIVAVVLGTFARLPSAGTPYVLFALAGFVLFGIFAGAVNRAAGSFIREGQLVTRIYFPRAVLPLAAGSVAILDFAVGLVVLLLVVIALGQPIGPSILVAPVIAFVTLGLGLVVGMAVAAVSAHYRDAAIAVPFALQLLLYASPVVYSSELIPGSLRSVYALNPLVPLVEAFRASVLGTPWPATPEVIGGTIVGLAVATLALLAYVRASRDLADVV
jgi:lipopolysaccharide transport system permease protein